MSQQLAVPKMGVPALGAGRAKMKKTTSSSGCIAAAIAAVFVFPVMAAAQEPPAPSPVSAPAPSPVSAPAATPVLTTPVQTAPVQTAPVQTTPAPATPASTTAAATAPAPTTSTTAPAPALAAHIDNLPDGWERPTDADLAGPNLQFRSNKPQRYLRADGDFDGDGQSDRVEMLVNRSTRTFAVYAFVSKSPTPIELADGRIGDVARMGISSAKPGRIRTACGKGYDAGDPGCKKGVPFVDVTRPSIEYFGFES